MATIRQQAMHWRDRYIARSEVISDAWQVFLAYSGRGAEIVLFICMAISLIQMIPTITLPDALTGAFFVIQMITLDIAGFGLTSLAKAVRRAGDEETAGKAEFIGTCLIIIMVISMLSGGIDRLFSVRFPVVKEYVGYLDDVLLLTRVVMTVFYGKIMHSLRDSQQHMQTVVDETEAQLREEITQLQTVLTNERQTSQAAQTRLSAELEAMKAGQDANKTELSRQVAAMKAQNESQTVELSSLKKELSNSRNESSMKAQQYSQNELSLQAKMQAAVKAAREEMQAQMKAQHQTEMQVLQAQIDDLKHTNSQLKAEMKGQSKAPVKQAKQVSSEKFDTRTFVFECLQENAEMKLSEIVMKAKLQGQELSEPTISRYRKEYRESSGESKNESSLG
jgi:hypothetical protein